MAELDDLKAYGANVDEGVMRCVNNPEFYLRMVKKAADDPSVADLENAINAGDLDQAFEIAHALKGVLANLALTPLCEPVSEMVELLRSRTETDYSGYIDSVKKKADELKAIFN